MRLPLLALLFIQLSITSTPSDALLCGKAWQNACEAWEKIPSCDHGLVERGGKCFKPKVKKKPKPKCGNLNERPCKVGERIPPCNRGLVQRQNKCRVLERLNCGNVNHLPCKAQERVPPCNKNLVENSKTNRCVRPVECGRNNLRPCKIHKRVPSCGPGLVEDLRLRKCVRINKFSRPELERTGNDIAQKHKRELIQLQSIFSPYIKRANKLHRSGRFDRLMQEENYQEIGRFLNLQQLQEEFRRQRQLDRQASSTKVLAVASFLDSIKSVSIGFSPNATALSGLADEWGIIFPITVHTGEPSIYSYAIYGYTVGAVLGGAAGIAVSIWLYEPKDLCGFAHAFTLGSGYDDNLSFTGWIPAPEQWHLYPDASNLPLYGLTMADVSNINIDINTTRALTIAKDSTGSPRCSECGSHGKRPCSIFERTPSCNAGLIEKYGYCLRSSDTSLSVPMQNLQ